VEIIDNKGSGKRARLDVLLYEKGLAPSRARARALIEEGKVLVNGEAVTTPHKVFDESVEITAEALPFVSRGGLKLEHALNEFGVDVRGAVCFDAGASTGGFTHCLLKRGAKRVYAVDVGHSQLAPEIANDPRVVSIEKTNIRYMEKAPWMEGVTHAVADVSFISLRLILENLFNILPEDTTYVCLVKPQFEVGKGNLSKNGIVLSKEAHISVLEGMWDFANEKGMGVRDITPSPIQGGDGNREYLMCFAKGDNTPGLKTKIPLIVKEAFDKL